MSDMHNEGPPNPWAKYDEMAVKMLNQWEKWVEEAGRVATANQNSEAGEASMATSISSFLGSFVAEQVDVKCREAELRGASHGANQARREVCQYLRTIGQPVTAMAIQERCKWPEKSS